MSRVFRAAVLSTFALGAAAAQAPTVTVTSVAQLQSAIDGAGPGDTIVVANGSYTTSGPITVTRAGTTSARITIAAQAVGGVTISGSAGFKVASPAAYVTIRGFRFLHSGPMQVGANTTACLVTRNLFQIPGGGNYLQVSGTDTEVSYNTFQNKSTSGAMLVLDEDTLGTLRPYAHHNHFHVDTYDGSNGGEAIRVFSILPRVEHNLFEQILVHGETISIKEGGGSQGGFYRYNTFRNCANGYLTMRYCRHDVVEGNFFLDSPGLRVYGTDQTIRNNYFQNANMTLGEGTTANTYIGIDRVEVSFNTFVNGRMNGENRGDTGVPPKNLTIANNIMVTDGGVFLNTPSPFTSATYEGNILWGTAAPGAFPSSGYRRGDPQLVTDAGGRYHLASTSPAVNTAAGAYDLADDIDGQSRSGTRDVGADEVSGASVVRRPLNPSDVGPGAGGTPTPAPTATATATRTATPTATATATPAATATPVGGFVEITPAAGAVTASTHDGNVPGNTVDNSLTTRWSANGDGQWIRYDLGVAREIAFVQIAAYNGNTRQNRFDLQVSTDGASWTNVVTGGLTSGTTTAEQTHDFPDVAARFVRYVGHGNTVNTFNSVTELSLFAPGAVATPTPTATPTTAPATKLPVSPAAVTASTHDGNVPANTVDGSLATRWSASGDGQWIQYDLGATKRVEVVKVAWYSGNTRTTTFDVLVADAVAGPWTTAAGGRTSGGTTTALETYDVADTPGRYVRVMGHGNSANTWNSIAEAEVWGR